MVKILVKRQWKPRNQRVGQPPHGYDWCNNNGLDRWRRWRKKAPRDCCRSELWVWEIKILWVGRNWLRPWNRVTTNRAAPRDNGLGTAGHIFAKVFLVPFLCPSEPIVPLAQNANLLVLSAEDATVELHVHNVCSVPQSEIPEQRHQHWATGERCIQLYSALDILGWLHSLHILIR